MLEKSFGMFFFLKKTKNQTGSDRYVYLKITVDGISKEISLKRTWTHDRWNQASGRASGTKEDARNLNLLLDSLASKVYQAKLDLIDQRKPVTTDSLKNVIAGKQEKKRMLLEIFVAYNDQIKALLGKGYSKRTLQRYNTTYDHTVAFILWKYKQADIPIENLDYEYAADFAFWLKTIKNCNHNSTMKYVSTVKRIVLQCVLKNWLKKDPFLGFKTATVDVEIIPLNQQELSSIENKVFNIERLNIVRDIFLFSCYTGLAYVDINNLKRNQIDTGIDGGKWIFTKRQKTKTPSRIPMLQPALEIFERYKAHPKCIVNDSVLPMLTNQKMNSYLKEIADSCRIDRNLTFHIARHTFATTITLSNGVPLETVSKMLGHKSIKQTQHYAKVVDIRISEDMKDLRGKLEGKNNS
jgi:site-specific recombinase XerD